jgi:hypothetical protein
MSEFGHAIGAPPHNGQARPYGQNVPFETDEAHLQEELHNIVDIHAQARQRGEAGDLTGARTMLEDALATGELRLGREDPRLAPLMVDLATIARRLGNLTEARNQLRRAYAIIVASAGPEHATSLSIEGRLAAVVYRLGEPTEAYDWHLADAGRRVLGSEHPAVRGAQQRLAASAHTPPSAAAPPPVVPADPPSWNADSQAWATDVQTWAAPPPATYTPVADGVYQRQPGITVVPPPPLPPRDVEVWPEPPPLPRGDGPIQRRSGHGGGVALVASLGAVILVAAAVVALQLLRPDGGPAAPDPVTAPSAITVPANARPTTTEAAPAPAKVVLRDDGGSVTLTWEDPGAGKVPFIVSGARDGNALFAMASVPPGQTTSTIYGLNVNYNYCFTVSAVWSSDNIKSSIRTCTYRLASSRAP